MVALRIAALAAVVLFAAPALSAECLQYGEVVTLTGLYAPAAAASIDGVARDVRGEPGRHADTLTMAMPICVDGDVVSGAIPDTLTVQLYCPKLVAADAGPLTLTGRLVGAHTGNGHTPVLLLCRT